MKRFEPDQLPAVLPLMPLQGFTLLPRMQFHVGVDDAAQIALVDDALRGNRMIGIIQPLGSDEGRAPLYHIGTAARIMSFEENDDGHYLISIAGVCRFRLDEEIHNAKDYRMGKVSYTEYLADLKLTEPYHFPRHKLVGQLRQFFDKAEIGIDWDAIGSTPDGLLVNTMSILCPFDVPEKQALLEAVTVEKRRETLETILSFATSAATLVQPMKPRARVVH